MMLIWGWHSPPALAAAATDPVVSAAMHAGLFASALLFWASVLAFDGDSRWRAVLLLLLTGKLFCLLGLLFTFAPASLFALPVQVELADQQLAGVLMIVACPATYVLAGGIISGRWFLTMARREVLAGSEPDDP